MKTILEICREVADLAAVKRPSDLFNASGQQDCVFLSGQNLRSTVCCAMAIGKS